MGFWDTITQTVTAVGRNAARLFVPTPGPTIANTYPDYEVFTPQYPTPNPYPLAVTGYRKNELVFACIDKKATANAEAPLRLYDDPDDNAKARKKLNDHDARRLIQRPNEMMSEVDFWMANEIYINIAGFAAWEIEFNNAGLPMNLWPMRPDWCSTRRGKNRPLEFVRYQPYGLPPEDIPIERVLWFAEFDPIYPLLKGLSRTAIALRTIVTDNAVTDYLASFFQRGAVVSGILSVEQSLQDAEAERIRMRWRAQHGGTDNWGDIAVLGNGAKYQATGSTFRDMDFGTIDGRDEVRICQVFGMQPILVSAKVGLDRATYSNFEQANHAFYQQTASPRWRWYQDKITSQLLPHYAAPKSYLMEFDKSKVEGLQENKDRLWARAGSAAKQNLITRDEFREEVGYDPIDNDDVFVGVTVRANQASDIAAGGPGEQPAATAVQVAQAASKPPAPAPAPVAAAKPAEPVAVEPKAPAANPADEIKALTEWRQRAIAAVKSGSMYLIDPSGSNVETMRAVGISIDLIGCKTAGDVREVFEHHWPGAPKVKAVPLEDRSGVMVGFFLSTHDARQIEPADDELPKGAEREEVLHLTLAFLGKADALAKQRQAITDAVDAFAATHAPMAGKVQGIGKFNGVEDGASDCIYASYDAVNLAQFRTELVAALDKAGVSVAADHGFVPHIALAYVPRTDELPRMTMPATPMTFTGLTLAWGNEHHIAPLRGETATKAVRDDRLGELIAEVRAAREALEVEHGTDAH